MKIAITLALALLISIAVSRLAISASCSGVPEKYGLDCSPTIVVQTSSGGCTFPAAFPCAMD